MQRRTAIEDVKTLQRQKGEAVQDLEGFANGLAQGSVKVRDGGVIAFDPDGGVGDGVDGRQREGEGMQMEIPSAQKVVRMPGVEWGKYHVVGGALDRLHEVERAGEVAREYDPFEDRLDGGHSRTGSGGNGTGTDGGDKRRSSGIIGERRVR